MSGLHVVLTLTATITNGLLAGVFYAFSCAVLSGLARTEDKVFVATMTAINRAIVNGWFALSFFGAPLLSAAALIAAVLALGPAAPAVWWTGAAVLAHGATWVITFAVNIPLNRRLDEADTRGARRDHGAGWGSGDQVTWARQSFEGPWRRWNTVRAFTSGAAFAGLVVCAVEYVPAGFST